jgi:hypothetical protein
MFEKLDKVYRESTDDSKVFSIFIGLMIFMLIAGFIMLEVCK